MSYLSYLLARYMGASCQDCARAGLLHDTGYSMKFSTLDNLLSHSARSVAIAKRLGETQRVATIIEAHMFPFAEPIRNREELVVWMADKLDAFLDLFLLTSPLDRLIRLSVH